MIQLDGVTKQYDSGAAPAVAGVSLTVGAGEAVAIMGPSGSGKSTLLHLIAALDRPTSGTVRVGGERVDLLSETAAARFRRRQVGMIFQFFNLLDDLTVIDNVLLPAQLAGARDAAARRRAGELLAALGVGHRRDAYPARLSGGERQRVAIARALAVDPKIVLMDEPFSALDPNMRGRMRVEMERIWLETGKTVVFVTHDIDEALQLADRTIVLSNKPTRVLEIIDLPTPRPRALSDPLIDTQRQKLVKLFRSLEQPAFQKEIVA
jgi:ABC-type nitrate/sulfonate/bicarbonate transport system ATPase subunit